MSNKKDQILQAVIDHIKTEGLLMNLTISEIAKKADVGKGTVYEYFNSKDEMIAETVVYMLEESSSIIFEQSIEDLDFETTLRMHIKSTMNILLGNTSVHALLMSEELGGIIPQQLKQKLMKKVKEIKIKYHNFLNTIIDKGVLEGSIKPVTDQFTIIVVGNMIVTSIMFYYHNKMRHNYQADDFVEKIYQLVLKILS